MARRLVGVGEGEEAAGLAERVGHGGEDVAGLAAHADRAPQVALGGVELAHDPGLDRERLRGLVPRQMRDALQGVPHLLELLGVDVQVREPVRVDELVAPVVELLHEFEAPQQRGLGARIVLVGAVDRELPEVEPRLVVLRRMVAQHLGDLAAQVLGGADAALVDVQLRERQQRVHRRRPVLRGRVQIAGLQQQRLGFREDPHAPQHRSQRGQHLDAHFPVPRALRGDHCLPQQRHGLPVPPQLRERGREVVAGLARGIPVRGQAQVFEGLLRVRLRLVEVPGRERHRVRQRVRPHRVHRLVRLPSGLDAQFGDAREFRQLVQGVGERAPVRGVVAVAGVGEGDEAGEEPRDVRVAVPFEEGRHDVAVLQDREAARALRVPGDGLFAESLQRSGVEGVLGLPAGVFAHEVVEAVAAGPVLVDAVGGDEVGQESFGRFGLPCDEGAGEAFGEVRAGQVREVEVQQLLFGFECLVGQVERGGDGRRGVAFDGEAGEPVVAGEGGRGLGEGGAGLGVEVGADDAQGERQAAAEVGDALGRNGFARDPVGADEAFEEAHGFAAVEGADGDLPDVVGRGEVGEAAAARDDRDAAGRGGQQRQHLRGVAGVVEDEQRPGVGEAGAQQRGGFVEVGRDGLGRDAECPEEPGERVQWRERGCAVEAAEVDVELPVREVLAHEVRPVERERGLAGAADPGDDRDLRPGAEEPVEDGEFR
ncbi:hypothetical protein GCM10010403_48820 [Glycomyces rutgersensis]|uniref:Uncharacterized protein n=2 Tax=Glycomyces TaxID=58113 RepID=A0A9X3SZE4_9ACTN|nr:hypothetical protein [Glycomyces lechevalierae]MDA1387286.1 hypothetical protein [Glycomyces lechevalierae]MDR7340037.1 hypothetical protein [Glycomyces lechevalierae]